MKIPYGTANFQRIREKGFFYVDKTPFLPALESAELGNTNLLFLRPRRMGKSCFASMLEHYYDLSRADQFDPLFRGLWVHEHPTPERSKYLVLKLDFAKIATDGGHDELRRGFVEAVKSSLAPFLTRYHERIPALGVLLENLDAHNDATALMARLLGIVASTVDRLYVIVDEYDNFANNLFSQGAQDLYDAAVTRTGFVRSFYATLKAGSESGAVERIFVTGVSPILLDDLSSGFNVLANLSQSPRFNTMAGFTHADVERAVRELLDSRPDIAAPPASTSSTADAPPPSTATAPSLTELTKLLEQYYDGYRFSDDSPERVFNADMVLYYLRELADTGRSPAEMLDLNVRTDHGRLRRLAKIAGTSGTLSRTLFETILTEGHIDGRLVRQFGVRSVASEDQFLSLLYYMGMLTLGAGQAGSLRKRFEIPNRVVRELYWDHLVTLLQEQESLPINTSALDEALVTMAVDGDIQPFLSLFHEKILKTLGLKDLRRFNEKYIKLMLVAFIGRGDLLHVLTEKELAQGYCDLFLAASHTVPQARFAWLLELKYLAGKPGSETVERAFEEANQQLERYASDKALLPLLTRGKELRAGALVFVGVQKVLFRAWPATGIRPKTKGRPAPRRKKKG